MTTILLVILGFAVTLGLMILRALALDEVKGRIQRWISTSVEATIASLPSEMQDEWAEEWRAEIAAVITMPLTAARTARGLRQSASQLIADPALVSVGVGDRARRGARARSRTHAFRLGSGRRLAELMARVRRVDAAAVARAAAAAASVVTGVGVVVGVVARR